MSPAPCPICDAPSVDPDRQFGTLPFRHCRACDFTFRPDRDATTTTRIYASAAYAERNTSDVYTSSTQLAEQDDNARRRLAWVRTSVAKGTLLDVGAAGGIFVRAARSRGFDACGVEPSPPFAAYARDVIGVPVRDGTTADLVNEISDLDVVTMWHVLEHIPHPVQELTTIRRLLAPSGRLFIEVPNATSVMAVSMGTNWPHLDPDVHVNQFSPTALLGALARAGFEVAEAFTVGHGAYLSTRHRLTPHHVAYRLKVLAGGGIRGRDARHHEFIRVQARPTAHRSTSPA